jgi:hypothetical protein
MRNEDIAQVEANAAHQAQSLGTEADSSDAGAALLAI